jgi:hypothetical protein
MTLSWAILSVRVTRAPTMTATNCARARRCLKSQTREDVREPKKGWRNLGKNLSFHHRTNPGWLQDIPADRGQRPLQQAAHDHNS